MTDDIVNKECKAFQWIGQSINTCDGCGKPIFDHDGDSRSHGGPFSDTFLLKPFDEAVIANWLINEWIDKKRAAHLLTVEEQIIVTEKVASNVVNQSQQHGTCHENTGTDEEYIEHLLLKLDQAEDEIKRLRKDKRELLQIAKLFADYGQCQAVDEYGDCIHIDGVCEWHSAEHIWESFCFSRGL